MKTKRKIAVPQTPMQERNAIVRFLDHMVSFCQFHIDVPDMVRRGVHRQPPKTWPTGRE